MNPIEPRISHNLMGNTSRLYSLNLNHVKIRSLLVPDYNGMEIIPIDDIQFIHSNGNYSEIIIQNERPFICSKTLKIFEQILPRNFYRIHHQYIVNKIFIKRIENSGKVILNNGIDLTIARSRKKCFMKWFVDSSTLVVE